MRKLLGVAAAFALAGTGLALYRYRERLSRWRSYARAQARLTDLCKVDPEVALAKPTLADREDILQADTAAGLLERACLRFAERPLFVCRDETRTSYSEVWQRVERLAGALQARGLKPQDRVGLCGFSGVDWIVADMACLYLNLVSVPVDHQITQEQFDHVQAETSMRAFFVSEEANQRLHFPDGMMVAKLDTTGNLSIKQLEDRALRCPIQKPVEGSLHSIVYTSGSTGVPKGVMLPYVRWTQTLRDGVNSPSVPRIELGYLALAHMAGRITIYKALMTGGLVFLAREAGMANFLADLAWARPTHLLAVPRVSQFLYQHFRSLSKTGEQFHRDVLGGRLLFVHTGAAITAEEVVRFMRSDLKLHVTDVYGSTEMGPVAVNGRIVPGVSYKLVERPELGYTLQDRPYPRGELAIKSGRATPGYFNNSSASKDLYDQDGYLLSGDIVEERAPGWISVLGRSQGVLRMSQGKFVQLGWLEELYTAECAGLQQLYLPGESERDFLLAVAVPSSQFEGSSDQLLEEMRKVAREKSLAPHEVPRDLLLEPRPFTVENGLLSAAQKPRRPRFQEVYGEQLKALYRQVEKRRTAAVSGDLGSVVSRVLGLPKVNPDSTFRALGGDSLAAAEVCQAMAQAGENHIPAELLLDPTITLAQIASRRTSRSFQQIHQDRPRIRPEELGGLRVRTGRAGTVRHPKRVFLTGSTGFLGRHLVVELLRQLPEDGKLVCLVRGNDRRLGESFLDPALAAEVHRLSSQKLEVVVGDLNSHRFGLPVETYQRLTEEIDSILHAGALVNHSLAYPDLFGSNVSGTASVAHLAAEGRPKSVHFVSTIGVVGGKGGPVPESTSALALWPDRPVVSPDYAAGYVSSKWAGEVLMDWLHQDTGLPVTINRCGLLLPGSEFALEVNSMDIFSRLFRTLLKTGLAPHSFSRKPREYQALGVDVAARFLAALALETRDGFARYHLLGSANPTLDQMVEWACLDHSIERLPYDRYYKQLSRELQALGGSERERTLFPLLDYWKRPAEASGPVASREQFEKKAREFGLAPSGLDEASFLRILESLT